MGMGMRGLTVVGIHNENFQELFFFPIILVFLVFIIAEFLYCRSLISFLCFFFRCFIWSVGWICWVNGSIPKRTEIPTPLR